MERKEWLTEHVKRNKVIVAEKKKVIRFLNVAVLCLVFLRKKIRQKDVAFLCNLACSAEKTPTKSSWVHIL